MNRKNTILMAVVINAVLLLGLLISAIRNPSIDPPHHPPEPVAIHPPKEEKVIQVARGDVVDQALKDLSEKAQTPSTPSKIDFAKELEAIAQATSKKTVAPPSPTLQETVQITVCSGDSLAKIANRYGTTIEAISSINHLKTTVLQIGQKLKVPSNKQKKAPPPQNTYYTVKKGDNPWTIAVKNQINVDELLRLNHLNEEKAKHLKPGERLKIR